MWKCMFTEKDLMCIKCIDSVGCIADLLLRLLGGASSPQLANCSVCEVRGLPMTQSV